MRCATCTWLTADGCLGRVAYGEPPVPRRPEDPACPNHEQLASCDPCGACCREAFDTVPADGGGLPDDLVEVLAPDYTGVCRVPGANGGTRCVCLRGDGSRAPFRCTHYAVRPDACRDLALGSENCLLARRRVGLSPPPADG